MIDGKSIRREAWRMSKERRWPLVKLQLLAAVPTFIFALLSRLYSMFTEGGALPQWTGWPFTIVSNLMSLGLFMVALRYADGDDDAPGGFFFYATRERFGKALLLTLSLWAVTTVFELISSGLNSYGAALELSGTWGGPYQALGSFVSLAGSFLAGIFLFFAHYLFAREPEGSVWGHWKRSFSLGSAYFIEIFVFLFWLTAPLIPCFFVAVAVMMAALVLSQAALFAVILLLLLGLFMFYSPYVTMADALFADTVMREEKKAERKREKKRKKLAVKGGEGWYAVNMVTGETKQRTEKQNKDEPWE